MVSGLLACASEPPSVAPSDPTPRAVSVLLLFPGHVTAERLAAFYLESSFGGGLPAEWRPGPGDDRPASAASCGAVPVAMGEAAILRALGAAGLELVATGETASLRVVGPAEPASTVIAVAGDYRASGPWTVEPIDGGELVVTTPAHRERALKDCPEAP